LCKSHKINGKRQWEAYSTGSGNGWNQPRHYKSELLALL
jgi:hypothetical protein